MKTRWSVLEEVGKVFDLEKAVAHNQGKISGSRPIVVTTDPTQWCYAAGFRLQPKALRRWSAEEPLLIRIETTVQTGRVGAIFVADDLQRVLGTTDEKSPMDGDATLEIVVDPAPQTGWLILRNTASAGKASRCEVRAIRTFRAGRAPVNPAGRLADVMSFGSKTIDLAKLETAVQACTDSDGNALLDAMRRKWSEVPAGLSERSSTIELARFSDEELWEFWSRVTAEATTGEGYSVRGWYHEQYRDILRGKRVLDVGSGLGIDGLTFARAGAECTFLDIAPGNLQILERLCRIGNVANARFHYLQNLSSIDALPNDFDVIWCQGSMIHAPFSFAQRESQALLRRLKPAGRWIELAYPRERWERDGRLSFREWGAVTDGERTPWVEWYDLARLRARLHPAAFDVVLHFNFHHDDFNWFDLIRRK